MTNPEPARILIVDDSPTNIVTLGGMLEGEYRTVFATSGAQALAALAQGTLPDLILLDLMMPDMDGYAVCAALKAGAATRTIPVIFITAAGDPQSETRALAVGGIDFIHKPVNAEILRARVALHLQLQRQSRALTLANAELARHRDHLEELIGARTRELAQARDAAEGASRAKSAFLANMGHELRTPMHQIMATGYLLQRDAADARTLERLGRIGTASHHLLGLINDILDYSESEAEGLRLDIADFALAALLEQAESDVRDAAARKGLTLVRTLDPAAPVWLRGDRARLLRILGGLLDNAVKFSEQGTIGLEVHQLAARPGTAHLCFEVTDQGIGMTPEVQGGLFEPFHQGDNSPTRRYSGTGLGLAFCKRLVALMSGEIGVESTPGLGSRFWFSLRLPVGAEPTGPQETAPPDLNQVRPVLAALEQLLAEGDFEAVRLWGESGAVLAPLLGEGRAPFEAALAAFDLDTALRLLRQSTLASAVGMRAH